MTLADSLIADVPRLSHDEQRFIRYILDRVLVVGRRSYSPWVAAGESRDMLDEAAQEAGDLAVYVAMDAVMRADARAQRRLCERHDSARAASDAVLAELAAAPVVEVRATFVLDEQGLHEVLVGGGQ